MQGKENADPIEPAPIINILAIIYSLKIVFLIKYIIVIISIFANTIKIINDIFVKLFKSTKFRLLIPYNEDVVVFVSVSIDILNEFSKFTKSKAKMLDKIKIDMIKKTKTRKAIFTS